MTKINASISDSNVVLSPNLLCTGPEIRRVKGATDVIVTHSRKRPRFELPLVIKIKKTGVENW